jgi:hypothetical protein
MVPALGRRLPNLGADFLGGAPVDECRLGSAPSALSMRESCYGNVNGHAQ